MELADGPPGTSDVRETNRCRVFPSLDERTGRVLVFAPHGSFSGIAHKLRGLGGTEIFRA